MNNSIIKEKILDIKKKLGKRLIILAHHYQRDEIVALSDFVGDSFALSQRAASDHKAEVIVFCGVHFMAESAAILSSGHQVVQIPDIEAGCPMADMASIGEVEKAHKEVEEIAGRGSVIPVVYMNSAASVKAHCGRKRGIVCTSSNSDAAFRYAFDHGEKIFFFPDEHLGRNTAVKLGIGEDEIVLWDYKEKRGKNSTENIKEDIKRAKIILWKGFCPIHTKFAPGHILKARAEFLSAKIVVHPECTQETVELADAVGSTDYIIKYVKNSAKGSTIAIGTEINLIKRLARNHPDKNIYPLDISPCQDMLKTTPENLLSVIENIGIKNIVAIQGNIGKDAKKALDRMLTL